MKQHLQKKRVCIVFIADPIYREAGARKGGKKLALFKIAVLHIIQQIY
jgi:hypothetical protein